MEIGGNAAGLSGMGGGREGWHVGPTCQWQGREKVGWVKQRPRKGELAGVGELGRLDWTQERNQMENWFQISNEFGFWKDFEEFYNEI
jgi:hypothetical protein